MKISSHIRRDRPALETQAEIFQALSSPIRLAIVTLLYERDRPVNEVLDALADMGIPKTADRTNVCKNLAVLRRLGIVAARREGRQRIYTLVARCLLEAMRCTLDVIAPQKRIKGRAGNPAVARGGVS